MPSTGRRGVHSSIRRLRDEREKLRARLRLQLGAEIEGPDRAELIARAASLQAASSPPSVTPAPPSQPRPAPHPRLEDELTAAMESLRRAIRQVNR
ncbi:MAG TPA: hypothetical protein VIX15_09250 [Streptosporangiaceae bacterium]